MAQATSHDKAGTFRALLRLARPYKKRFLIIGVLGLLGTSADLLQPLIYRVAINDVAGLFVDRTIESRTGEADALEDLGIDPLHPGANQPNASQSAGSAPETTKRETGKAAITSGQRRAALSKRRREQELERTKRTQLQHRPGFVAPRTGEQALETLLWAVL